MSNACTTSQYFSGQGGLLLGERDLVTGKPLGLTPVGNVPALSLSVATTVFEHKESCTGVRGVDFQVTQELNASMAYTAESINKENLAIGLYGTSNLVASGSVTDETSKAYLGKWMPLDNIKISNAVVTNSDGTTIYVITTDYLINEDAGSFMAVSGGGISDADDVLLDYDYAEQSNVDALTSGTAPDRWLRFEGLNTAKGNDPVIIDVFKVNTQPLANLALIQDELASTEIAGKILSDALRTTGSKYFRVRYV